MVNTSKFNDLFLDTLYEVFLSLPLISLVYHLSVCTYCTVASSTFNISFLLLSAFLITLYLLFQFPFHIDMSLLYKSCLSSDFLPLSKSYCWFQSSVFTLASASIFATSFVWITCPRLQFLGFSLMEVFPILVTGESPYPLLVVHTFLSLKFEPSLFIWFFCFRVSFLFMSLLYHVLLICQHIF